MNNRIKKMAYSAMIAAIYFVCCFVEQGFASGAIQCRLSEGLTILPLFFPEAIIGITIGCLIFNLTQGILYDVIFGTLATLLAALLTYFIGKVIRNNYLKFFIGGLFPVLINALVIPAVIIFGYGSTEAYFFLFFTIGIGQLIAVYGFGGMIYFLFGKHLNNIFPSLTNNEL